MVFDESYSGDPSAISELTDTVVMTKVRDHFKMVFRKLIYHGRVYRLSGGRRSKRQKMC
jgi:hypothetical protein